MRAEDVKRIVTEGTMRLPALPERVFPLLCPVREHEWIETWDARIVYTESGFAEDGCVFTTTGDDGVETVWMVTRYEPAAGAIEFVMVTPGQVVTRLAISLRPDGEGTLAIWRRTFVPLSPAAGGAVAEMAARAPARLRRLEAQLDHYLRTGTMLRS